MKLLTIRDQLQDTQAALAQVERAFAAEPPTAPSQSLLTTAKSLEKRRRELEAEFIEEANDVGLDVCTYRLYAEDNRPTIDTVAGTLGSFQRLVSIVYDAKKHGRKRRQRVGTEVALETAFEFGYTFAGSVGFVFTMPNERLLLDELSTRLDETFGAIFEMSRAAKSSQLIDFAHTLGVASIRAMYKWASEHVRGKVGAGITWQRNEQIRSSGSAQLPALMVLREVIAATSEASTKTLVVSGVLLGADVKPPTFHFKSDHDQEMRGAASEDAIGPLKHPQLHRRYVATIERTEVVHYATDEEDVKYHLLNLVDTGVRPYGEDAEKADEEEGKGA